MNSGINESVGGALNRRVSHFRGEPELISSQARELLNVRRLPAMLNTQQAAVLLGVADHDIPALVRAGLLEPLGNPSQNAVKYFASLHILELAGEPAALSKIRQAIYEFWHNKNSAKQMPRHPRKGGRNHD